MPFEVSCIQPSRILAITLALALTAAPVAAKPQERAAPTKLKLVIIEGEGAINNVRERTAREPIVQVTDENDRPVAGATVFFMLPDSGPTAVFPDGTNSLRVLTDNQGRAIAKGLKASTESGKYQIRVEASYQNVTASTTINQANAVLSVGAGGGGLSGKAIAIIVAVGAGAAAGIAVAATGGDSSPSPSPTPTPTPTRITPGTPAVGAP
jgi:hypothetical protein